MNRRSILTLSAALLCTGVVHAAAQNAPNLTTAAKLAGRRYPNLVDNMRASRAGR